MNKSQEESKNPSKDILLVFGSGECDQLGIDLQEAESSIISVPSLIPNWSQTIKKVVCGAMHTLILTADGRVFSFGCNDDGALGRPEDDTPFIKEVVFEDQVTSLSAGDSHSVAVTVNNKLFVWGQYRNVLSGGIGEKVFAPKQVGKFELGRLPIRKIASGSNHTLVLAGKKIFSWGDPECGATGRKLTSRRKNTQSLRIEALRSHGPVDVWAGSYFSFYKDAKGRVYSFGLNNYGQLGLGNTKDKHEPTLMKGVPSFAEIQGGEHHAIGLTEQGEIYGWGRNDDSQLGFENQGDKVHCEIPTKVEGFDEKIQRIVVGGHYSYAFSEKKRLYSWGFGDQYVLANESEETETKPFKVGTNFFPRNFDMKYIGCGGQHVVVGGSIGGDSTKEGTEISLTNMKREIKKIESTKKTYFERQQEFGEEDDDNPPKRAKGGFFVNSEYEARVKASGSYRGVSGMTEEELKQEYKEQKPAPFSQKSETVGSAKASSGFFVNKDFEQRTSGGYRGVSGMTEEELKEEYKEEETSKPSQTKPVFSQSKTTSNPFGQRSSSSNPFSSANPFSQKGSQSNQSVWGAKKSSSPFSNPFKKE